MALEGLDQITPQEEPIGSYTKILQGPNEQIFLKWVHVSTKACFRPVTFPSIKHEA